MKKFFTLCLCALLGATLAQAQVKVTCDGKEVKDGDRLTFYAHEDDFGDIAAGPAMDPTFKNTTDADFDLTVEVKTSDNAKNGGLNWCGITMMCQDIKGGYEKRTAKLKVKGFGLSMRLHGLFTAGKFDTYEAEVTVWKGSEKLLTFTEVFVYDGKDHTGIDHVSASQPVRFDGQALRYSFDTEATRTLTLYGIDGKQVRTEVLSQGNGSVSLAGLKGGVYVYRLTENGRTLQGSKVVVR